MTTTRHLLIRRPDGRTVVVDDRTGAPAGVLDMGESRGGPAFIWSRFARWFVLGFAAGVMACKAGGW